MLRRLARTQEKEITYDMNSVKLVRYWSIEGFKAYAFHREDSDKKELVYQLKILLNEDFICPFTKRFQLWRLKKCYRKICSYFMDNGVLIFFSGNCLSTMRQEMKIARSGDEREILPQAVTNERANRSMHTLFYGFAYEWSRYRYLLALFRVLHLQ